MVLTWHGANREDILTDAKLDILESYIQQRSAYFIRLLDEKYINFIHPNIPQQ